MFADGIVLFLCKVSGGNDFFPQNSELSDSQPKLENAGY